MFDRDEIGRDLDRERANAAHWETMQECHNSLPGRWSGDLDPEPERHAPFETLEYIPETGDHVLEDNFDLIMPCRWRGCQEDAEYKGYCDIHYGTL